MTALPTGPHLLTRVHCPPPDSGQPRTHRWQFPRPETCDLERPATGALLHPARRVQSPTVCTGVVVDAEGVDDEGVTGGGCVAVAVAVAAGRAGAAAGGCAATEAAVGGGEVTGAAVGGCDVAAGDVAAGEEAAGEEAPDGDWAPAGDAAGCPAAAGADVVGCGADDALGVTVAVGVGSGCATAPDVGVGSTVPAGDGTTAMAESVGVGAGNNPASGVARPVGVATAGGWPTTTPPPGSLRTGGIVSGSTALPSAGGGCTANGPTVVIPVPRVAGESRTAPMYPSNHSGVIRTTSPVCGAWITRPPPTYIAT